ncbi:hypothetical protein ACIBF5_32475 [Micromonospora sp. NPDC050417]|uniref:hypothetical protein n=1 Tax=Micromonospora sp. NPDC050417 TaxID=3364280 RepID=UPI0037BDC49C
MAETEQAPQRVTVAQVAAEVEELRAEVRVLTAQVAELTQALARVDRRRRPDLQTF